jgi:hypothetical protein
LKKERAFFFTDLKLKKKKKEKRKKMRKKKTEKITAGIVKRQTARTCTK